MRGAAESEAAAGGLLGREEQLAVLQSMLADASSGRGRVALVAGETGFGKTSLGRRFAQQVRHEARVLWGACDPLFTPRPLGPLYDLVREAGRSALGALDPERDRTRLLAALLEELGSQPTVAVVEDVHWVDEASLDALRYLARRIEHLSCLLVLTYRDDELGRGHPLRYLLGAVPTGVGARVELGPLSERAVETLAAAAGRSAEGLHALTGGNPFFVTEVLAAGADGVPATVRDAVLARALGLPPGAREVLDFASVVPGAVERWLLDAVLSAAAAAANACVEQGMLVPSPAGLAFRHELARLAVLEALDPTTRAEYHRAVLQALETLGERGAQLSRLAQHAAGEGNAEAVLRHAPHAARRASAVGSHREAAAHYATALGYAGAADARLRLALLEGTRTRLS